MSTVKFKKEKQEKIKVLSKIISIIALIGKIFMCIALPIILMVMIAVPILINKIDVKDDEIVFNDESIKLEYNDDSVTLKYKDSIILAEDDITDLVNIKDIIQNNSKGFIITYVESMFGILIIILVLMFMVLNHLQKLFKNIYAGDTPFTLDNVSHIRKMAYYLIAVIVSPYILGSIFEIVLNRDLNINFNMINLIQVLFLFSMAYIFEYGYEIQLDSKGKMYGEDE